MSPLVVGFDTSALDAGFKAHAGRGIGRYVRELKRYFDSLSGDAALAIKEFSHRDLRGGGTLSAVIERLPLGRQTARQQVMVPLELRNGPATAGCDVLHFPAHMDAPAWCTRRSIITVLDLIPLVFAELYRADRPTWRFAFGRWLELRAIRNASLILAISENTARDVVRILGVPRERIVVTPLGVDAGFFAAGRIPADERDAAAAKYGVAPGVPLLLYVGGIDQRKNAAQLIRCFAALLRDEVDAGRPAPMLLMAGRAHEDAEFPKLARCIADEGVTERVLIPGIVPEDDLLRLYARADLFFFPSLYEGFGLTPLEALAAGTPVVSSNTSAMPEVLGSAALLVDPSDTKACVAGLREVLRNRDLRERLKAAGPVQAALFNWRRTGELTVEAYRRFAHGI